MSAFFGSTTTLQKYQPRPQRRLSPETRLHLAPAAFAASRPPAFASTMAQTRLRFVGATAMPMRPSFSVGSPFVSGCHVEPPSVDLNMPPPGPYDGGEMLHGGRRGFPQMAEMICEIWGSKGRSAAPTLSFLNSALCHVAPPSPERETSPSGFGP